LSRSDEYSEGGHPVRGTRLQRRTCLRSLRRVDVGGQSALRDLDQRRERRGLVDREFGEHAAVDRHAGQVQTLDEAVVGQAVGAGTSVDALDPQTTEVALALAAVAVRVDQRVGDLLLSLAVEARTLPAVTRGAVEDCTTL